MNMCRRGKDSDVVLRWDVEVRRRAAVADLVAGKWDMQA